MGHIFKKNFLTKLLEFLRLTFSPTADILGLSGDFEEHRVPVVGAVEDHDLSWVQDQDGGIGMIVLLKFGLKWDYILGIYDLIVHEEKTT